MSDGKITIEALLDSSKFEKGIKGLASQSKKGLGIATKAIGVASAGIAAFGGFAIKAGSDFKEGMSKVEAISGASKAEMKDLTELAKKMGATTKFTAREAADGLSYMAMAGWKAQEMTDGLPGIMNLAAAAGADLALTSDIVTDALTAFKLEAKDAGHFADIMAAASSNANTNVEMLGESFKYAAPVAGALGYTAEDTSLALGLMANSGIKASQAGTSLRGAITRLARPTKQVQAMMDKYGFSLTDAQGKVKPLRDLLVEFRKKLGNVSEAERAQAAAMLFGQNAMSGMLAIINSGDKDFDKLANSIDNAEGSAEKMAKTMQNNLKGQITILKSALEGVGIQIFESVNSPLTKATKSAIKSVDSINRAFKRGGSKAAAEEFGKRSAKGLAAIAKESPKLVRIAGQAIKGFVKGIYQNRGQIVKAAQGLIRAFGEAVSAFLPKALGNSVKNLANIFAGLLVPAGKLLNITLKMVNAVSWLIPPVMGAVAAYKAYAVVQKSTILLDTLAAAKKKALAVIETYSAARKAALTATTTSLTASTVAQTAATTAYSVSAGVAAVATKALSAAVSFLGGPVGVALAAIGALVGVVLMLGDGSSIVSTAIQKEGKEIGKLAKSVDELTDSYKENKKARESRVSDTKVEAQMVGDLTSKLTSLVEKEKKTADEKARIKAYVEQLNAIYPELNLKYDEEKDKLNKSTKALWKRVEALKAEAKAKAYVSLYEEAYKEEVKLSNKLLKMDKAREKAKKSLTKAEKDFNAKTMQGATPLYQRYARADLARAKKNLKEISKSYDKTKKAVKEARKEVKNYDSQLTKAFRKEANKKLKPVKAKVKVEDKDLKPKIAGIRKVFEKLSGKIDKETKKQGKSIKNLPKAGNGIPGQMRSVGTNIMQGLVTGIRSKGSEAKSTMRGIMGDLVSIAKKVPDIHSPSRVFSWIGSMMMKGLTRGLRREGKHSKRALKWILTDEVNDAKKVKGNFEGFGEKLSSQIEKALDKRAKAINKQYSKMIEKAFKGDKKKNKKIPLQVKKAGLIYEKALDRAFSRIESKVKQRIMKLSRAFQKAYNRIIDNRKAMRDMLKNHGSILVDVEEQNETATVRDISLSGMRSLNTFDVKRTLKKNIADMKVYRQRLQALEGKVSKEILNDIVNMGLAEGSDYAKRLLKLSPSELQQYVNDYKAMKADEVDIVKRYGEERLETEKNAADKSLELEKSLGEKKKSVLRDLTVDIANIEAFKKNIKKLKKLKAPKLLMKELFETDPETANEIMTQIFDSEKGGKTFIKNWKKRDKLADKISKEFYAKDIKDLRKKYQDSIKKLTKTVRKDMESVGDTVLKTLSKKITRDGDIIGKSLSKVLRKAVNEAKQELNIEAGPMVKKAKTASNQFNSRLPESTKRSIIEAKSNDSIKKRTTVIHTDVVLDGKVIAKATAKHTDAELGKRKKRKRRGI